MVRSEDGAGARRRLEVPIIRLTDAAVARTIALRLAVERGFDRRVASSIAIVASELATNAVRHAGGGTMEVEASASGIEIRCADRGAGDPVALERKTREPPPAFRPREGLGQGLAAAARLSHALDIRAREGGGIVISAAWRHGPRASARSVG